MTVRGERARRKSGVQPSQVRLRRKPTEQSARTRAHVIDTAITCLSEEGFHRATTSRIAERAGLTWGVLQYHFGDKDGILSAVLDHAFTGFADELREALHVGGGVRDRVQALVDVVWGLMNQPGYRATMEILRNTSRDDESSIDADRLRKAWAVRVGRLWDRAFPELRGSRRPARHEAAKRLLFAATRGLVEDRAFAPGMGTSVPRGDLDALAEAVVFLLDGMDERSPAGLAHGARSRGRSQGRSRGRIR